MKASLLGIISTTGSLWTARSFSTVQSFHRMGKSSPLHSSSKPEASTTRQIKGVRDIVDDYDVFLLDMWGVMHDGTRPYEGVLDVVKKLREAGKHLVILSNSSKRRDNSVKMLKKLGFDPNDFEQIITSGEVAFQMLAGEGQNIGCDPWKPLLAKEKNVFIFGSGDGDQEYCSSAGWNLSTLEEASVIVARGTFTVLGEGHQANKNENDELYTKVLNTCLDKASKKRIPMLVSNPDKVRPDAERPPMPGKIAADYTAEISKKGLSHDGLIKSVGKPFPDVYNIALQGISNDSSGARVCMIGDALETDVTGGSRFGIDTVWVVLDGIHAADLDQSIPLMDGAVQIIDSFNKQPGTYSSDTSDSGLTPTLLLPHFRW